jgi:hypothetical protein
MKKILILVALLSPFVTHAQAEQYSFYVTHAQSVNPNQIQFSSMVQKTILIDTVGKRVRLSLSSICGAGMTCPEMIKYVNFKLTGVQKQGAQIVRVKAEGYVMINGNNAYTTLEISQNRNNATTIQVVSQLQREMSSSAVSVFYGSPSELNSNLF